MEEKDVIDVENLNEENVEKANVSHNFDPKYLLYLFGAAGLAGAIIIKNRHKIRVKLEYRKFHHLKKRLEKMGYVYSEEDGEIRFVKRTLGSEDMNQPEPESDPEVEETEN